ncbi:nitroreductase family protein [Flavobacterium johnsoniae]|uniref:Nitroreductase n=1 Tax=Flavobacterium johnsoniae (strain ATCC 17061 / DSM 2064 / JCM 8514 / BCRC 14874 / CCUG 350202 / NBRC 14942 / NCIMB 11054 / UW101) TaxID=376686 RepID=A5FF24_FLAJ1|nr:nitroreductase [Flavobacterium johnsoniae]ABQ06187.1 nitroreductase [Flavobacterium johnsoniae UW101]OXE98341.1 nitroreductase [Flavobacterium johnsoniae UW101]WQG81933.1 nitroreductase [Flavobacterium johnsoniae UW101]SHK68297.1 Nitroreductase [Flavobacterium johnsoniae]
MNISTKPSKIKVSDFTHRQNISKIIRTRRSVYADEFIKQNIPDELLNEILINATYAPTHKMTEPWRFIVFKNSYLEQLGSFLADYYRDLYFEKFSAEEALEKYNLLKEYPLNSACVIGVVMVRNTKINLPEWEEVAAVSSAVQNIALSCTAHDIGSYWSTSAGAVDYVKQFDLAENEQSLGLIYVGYYPEDLEPSRKKRTPISNKVTYFK